MPAEPARFAFKSKNLEVEFEGTPDFVTAQIERLKGVIVRETEAAAPGGTGEDGGADGDGAGGARRAVTLDQFYRRAKSREGRGALQETILIFAYYLREYRGQDDFSIENLNACFSVVGVTPPKSLANTLGIMKRNQKFFHAGARRGRYTLTEKGVAYVRRLIGAQ